MAYRGDDSQRLSDDLRRNGAGAPGGRGPLHFDGGSDAAGRSGRRGLGLRGVLPASSGGAHSRDLAIKDQMQIVKRRRTPVGLAWMAALSVLLLAVLLAGSAYQSATRAEGSTVPESKDPLALSSSSSFSASFVGNVMLGQDVESAGAAYGYDSLFSGASKLWDGCDYVFGNLECALLDQDDTYSEAKGRSEYYSAPDTVSGSLAQAGFTVLQLANNHTTDYGKKGLRNTLYALASSGISPLGAGENLAEAQTPMVTTAENGLVIKTISVSDVIARRSSAGTDSAGISTTNADNFTQAVYDAASTSDLLIVTIHWGEEDSRHPTEDQRELAHELIDAGADIIIGSHANVIEPIERYRDGIIFYDLGNFVSDASWTRNRDGALVRFDVSEDGSSRFTVYPLHITACTPTFTSGGLSSMRTLKSLTSLLGPGDYTVSDGVLTIPFREITPTVLQTMGVTPGEVVASDGTASADGVVATEPSPEAAIPEVMTPDVTTSGVTTPDGTASEVILPEGGAQ